MAETKNIKVPASIANLYSRKAEMEKTFSQIDEEIERNNFVISLLNRAENEQKKRYEIDKFIDTIQKQVDSYVEQKAKLQSMYDCTCDTIRMYETNREDTEYLLDTVLRSLGF